MDKKLQQEMSLLKKEMERDQKQIQSHKQKMIEEIKRIDRKKLFEEKPKNKISIMDKILKILGYGKKG